MKIKTILEGEYSKMPAGELLVSPGSSNNSFRYYLRESPKDKCGVYLDKTKKEVKEIYANKKYIKELMKNVNAELLSLKKIDSLLVGDSIIETYERLNPGVKKLILPINVDDNTFTECWLKKTYQGLGFDSADTTAFYSDKGERMRSKSEVLIANTLNKMNIAYKYECPIARRNGELLYPDFTILDIKRRREIYWEHLGKMDDLAYISRNIWKMDEYKQVGIQLGINLFVTYETKKCPLGTKEIDNLIQVLFL